MTGRCGSWLLGLICLHAASTLALTMDKRSEQTQAKCSPDFSWADNSQGLSPCLLTAFVWGSCFTGNWNVPALQQGETYSNPNSTTANLCTCSRAAYNLISACTACQGLDSSIQNWAAYDQGCSGFQTDAYFPSNVTLPTGTAIPFWAGTDPASWNDGRFDAAQAQLVAKQNHPDFVQSTTTGTDGKKSKAPIGAIVGGVVGGLAVLAIGASVAFWFTRRGNGKDSQSTIGDETHSFGSRPHIHGRSMSDLSAKHPQSMSMVYSHRPGTIYTTGTHTRTGSVHSLSAYGSGYSSPQRVISPIQLVSRESAIDPFPFRATSPPPPGMTRKTSETTMRAAYNGLEPPVTPPAAAAHHEFDPFDTARPRLNPPAYSPYASPAASPEPAEAALHAVASTRAAMGHGTRNEKASVDSQQSFSSGSATTHGPGESTGISAIDDVIGRMGLILGPETVAGSTMGGHTVSTGQSATVLPRPGHKVNVSNPDNDPDPVE
ncbi:hypothetical protein B0H15DRAFT_61617 [Mycena belliarum]|uniref:Transmembrane protein n=1 Tax=Mycena belliarum TaxID=1033014 RepID=A0AAD6TQN9_9AGAR|nr:hypothetical protein B0H15DRAFT_61617 [Mycena belliae]